jgi:phosphoribosylamine---glycine ligase
MKEIILIFGQGGREHALAYHFSVSPSIDCQIIVCPGNAGIAQNFSCVDLQGNLPKDYVAVARKIRPRLIVIGPEDPLANGVADALMADGFFVFGPQKACALLESSKSFMKMICQEANIKTASAQVLKNLNEVDAFFADKKGRYVVKADGLCAGKGVTVCDDLEQAKKTCKIYLGEKDTPLFREASSVVVVEEFLLGDEVSVIGICDGEDVLLLPPVLDHKRLGEDDTGPNTGGMGVVGPIFGSTEQIIFLNRVKQEIFLPTLHAMKQRGTPYRGFLYAGLMVHGSDINLLEFNVRLGDPEAQAILYGIVTNLFPVCDTIARGGLLKELGTVSIEMSPTAAVVMASLGYPGAPLVGDLIFGLENFTKTSSAQIFFAGVKKSEEGSLVTASGRVLSCVSSGENLQIAIDNCYKFLGCISFFGVQYRRDIGRSLLM